MLYPLSLTQCVVICAYAQSTPLDSIEAMLAQPDPNPSEWSKPAPAAPVLPSLAGSNCQLRHLAALAMSVAVVGMSICNVSCRVRVGNDHTTGTTGIRYTYFSDILKCF